MKVVKKHIFKTIVIILSSMVIYGCATAQPVLVDVNIEKTNSRFADIGRCEVTSTEKGVIISGILHSRYYSRSAIPGHIHIEVISSDGIILDKYKTKYHRKRYKSRQSIFHINISEILPAGSSVHIIHHSGFEEVHV